VLALPSSKRKQSGSASSTDNSAQKRSKVERSDASFASLLPATVKPLPPPTPAPPTAESPASVTSNIVAPGIEAYESKKYRGKLYIIDEKTKNPLWITVTADANNEEVLYSCVDSKGVTRQLNIVKINYVDKE
jgi:hypothetical protein